jgi:pantoate--beta-alanine ligase
MKRCSGLSEWTSLAKHLKSQQKAIGFIPTMGALHEGHLSLVRRSVRENDATLVSIFINPTQFDDPKDLVNYPQDISHDIELLTAAGADIVLTPTSADLYPDDYQYRVSEQSLSRELCGAHRPGHFEGMLSVVLKLINISSAAKVYFGEKDWQQLELVRGMVRAFFIPVKVVACPTVREADGLAMSSRNRRLSRKDRLLAPAFYRAISSTQNNEQIQSELESLGFEVDYIKIHNSRRLGAVKIGGVRLIDNVMLPLLEVAHDTHA